MRASLAQFKQKLACRRVLPHLGWGARMEDSMSNETYDRALSNETSGARPRVGVPWRTAKEEADGNRLKIEYYYQAIEAAGGEPVPISLSMSPAELDQLARTL